MMNQNQTNLPNGLSDRLQKNRKLRFGAFAVGLTVSVCALAVILNVVFSSLCNRYGWFGDMTGEHLYGISDSTYTLLDGFRGTEDFRVTFSFCQSADRLDESQATRFVHTLVKRYAETFDFVDIEYLDIYNHPDKIPMGLDNVGGNDVIATCGNQTKKLALSSFFVTDPDTSKTWAFNGEYRLNVTILQFSGGSPVAYFTEGHGEKNEQSSLWQLFEDAGYDVRLIDLAKQVPEQNAKVMVINAPVKDFMGADDAVNEIRALHNFLTSGGGLMVFADADAEPLPELDELLADWGIAFGNALVRDYDNSLPGTEGKTLLAEYATEGSGSSLTASLRGLDSLPRTVVNNARPIEILFTENQKGTSGLQIAPVLMSSSAKTAIAVPRDGEGDTKGDAFPLMTISVDARYVNDTEQNAYVLACGTADFAADHYLDTNKFGNRDLMFFVMRSFSRKTTPLDSYDWLKPFDDTALTIGAGAANRYTALLTAVIPAALMIAGAVVYARRRFL